MTADDTDKTGNGRLAQCINAKFSRDNVGRKFCHLDWQRTRIDQVCQCLGFFFGKVAGNLAVTGNLNLQMQQKYTLVPALCLLS
jgi:hypothetical protein